jgi:hypothetical protein
VQALLRDANPNLRSPAQISLDPGKHLRPPSFEEGIAEYVSACYTICHWPCGRQVIEDRMHMSTVLHAVQAVSRWATRPGRH